MQEARSYYVMKQSDVKYTELYKLFEYIISCSRDGEDVNVGLLG
jgi:hypothetical protein